MTHSVINEIETLLSEDWAQVFGFNLERARAEALVILCWKKTGCPIPLKLKISDKALNEGHINWRDLRRLVKDCLPEKIISKKSSEAKYLLRMASRRNIKDVEKDILEWLQITGDLVRQMFGTDQRDRFLAGVNLAANVRAGSLQALESLVDEKVELLLELY